MRAQAGNGLFLSRHFQNAYTTRDIDAAAKMFAERHGIRAFHYMRDVPMGDASIHIGLAWAGDVMIELIQPNSDVPLYSGHVPPAGQLVRLHHLGHLIDDRAEYDAVVARASASGYPVALQGNSYGINYCYLDVRSDAGHFLEYVHLDPPMAQFFAPVPRN
jgi:Glyoxalase/Bleomycin resistance protein/Dioxygenase superfamily